LLDFVSGRRSARLRYALATATLLVMASLPVVTFATLRGRVETPSASGAGAASSAGRSGDARGPLGPLPAAPGGSGVGLRARLAPVLPAVVGAWCAGVLLLSVRYLGGWQLVRRMRLAARPFMDPVPIERLAALCGRMRVRRGLEM